jgi:hypothetical protein
MINGYELSEIELKPLILKTGGLFKTPFGWMMFTPAACPANAWSKLCTGLLTICADVTFTAEPV